MEMILKVIFVTGKRVYKYYLDLFLQATTPNPKF